jgi:hypothetical protein
VAKVLWDSVCNCGGVLLGCFVPNFRLSERQVAMS